MSLVARHKFIFPDLLNNLVGASVMLLCWILFDCVVTSSVCLGTLYVLGADFPHTCFMGPWVLSQLVGHACCTLPVIGPCLPLLHVCSQYHSCDWLFWGWKLGFLFPPTTLRLTRFCNLMQLCWLDACGLHLSQCLCLTLSGRWICVISNYAVQNPQGLKYHCLHMLICICKNSTVL